MAKKTESQFLHEKEILDGALRLGGADVEFPTHGKAVAFRHRCYAFRKFKREALGELSPYERLTIEALSPDDVIVRIRPRTLDAKVTFLNETVPEPEIEIPEEMFEEAEDLKNKIFGSIDL